MKFFVTGVNGQLGHDVLNEVLKREYEGVGSDIGDLDITDREAVEKVISQNHPDAVIHCAAWTAVDLAEVEENKAHVYAVNVDGTRNIAEACRKFDCKMTYISTDYVFDGQGIEPWKPDCKICQPLNTYGKSKLEGELAVSSILEKYYIVRSAWVFGMNGNNFVTTMLKAGKICNVVRVVNDQVGTPTYSYDLARLLVDMNETDKYGYYHVTNEGGGIKVVRNKRCFQILNIDRSWAR